MRLTYRGHSCFEVEVSGTDFLIDPHLEPGGFSPGDLDPDYLLLTHGHGDHVGAAEEFDVPVVAIPEVGSRVEAPENINMNIGGTVSLGGAEVHMTMAFHSSSMDDFRSYGGMPAGYVVEGEKGSVYHPGDTSLFVDMRETIAEMLEPDVAVLPIGDHYTMGPESAAKAAEWLGVDVAVPMHYDTFPVIEQDPEEFVELLPEGVRGVVMEPGETLTYRD